MKLDMEQAIEDAVHVRAWIQRLNRGERITMIAGSPDHARLLNVVGYIEGKMKGLQSKSKPRPALRTETENAASLRTRKFRLKKTKRVHRLIDKYFEIHGEKDGPANDQDAEETVPQGSEPMSVLQD